MMNGNPNHMVALHHVLGGHHHVEEVLPWHVEIAHSGPTEKMDDSGGMRLLHPI